MLSILNTVALIIGWCILAFGAYVLSAVLISYGASVLRAWRERQREADHMPAADSVRDKQKFR